MKRWQNLGSLLRKPVSIGKLSMTRILMLWLKKVLLKIINNFHGSTCNNNWTLNNYNVLIIRMLCSIKDCNVLVLAENKHWWDFLEQIREVKFASSLCFLSSCGHVVQKTRIVRVTLVESHIRTFWTVKTLKSMRWFHMRRHDLKSKLMTNAQMDGQTTDMINVI